MVVVSPISEKSQIFFTSHLAGVTDPTTAEMRHRDLIVLKRGARSRFFDVPIAIIAHLSLKNEFNPYGAKLGSKRESSFYALDFNHVFALHGLNSFFKLRRATIAIGTSKKREQPPLSKNIRSRCRISTSVGSVEPAKCLVKKIWEISRQPPSKLDRTCKKLCRVYSFQI